MASGGGARSEASGSISREHSGTTFQGLGENQRSVQKVMPSHPTDQQGSQQPAAGGKRRSRRMPLANSKSDACYNAFKMSVAQKSRSAVDQQNRLVVPPPGAAEYSAAPPVPETCEEVLGFTVVSVPALLSFCCSAAGFNHAHASCVQSTSHSNHTVFAAGTLRLTDCMRSGVQSRMSLLRVPQFQIVRVARNVVALPTPQMPGAIGYVAADECR